MPNGLYHKLKDVRYVSYLKKYIIWEYIHRRLIEGAIGAIVMTRGNIDGTIYLMSKMSQSIEVARIVVDVDLWHHNLMHIIGKGMKSLLSKPMFKV